MKVVLAQGGDAARASRYDELDVTSFQCANRLARHPCTVPDIARVQGGQAATMELLWVVQLHPEAAQGTYDRLPLFGIEVVGHTSGKERYSASRRSIGNDRSFRWQGVPARN